MMRLGYVHVPHCDVDGDPCCGVGYACGFFQQGCLARAADGVEVEGDFVEEACEGGRWGGEERGEGGSEDEGGREHF